MPIVCLCKLVSCSLAVHIAKLALDFSQHFTRTAAQPIDASQMPLNSRESRFRRPPDGIPSIHFRVSFPLSPKPPMFLNFFLLATLQCQHMTPPHVNCLARKHYYTRILFSNCLPSAVPSTTSLLAPPSSFFFTHPSLPAKAPPSCSQHR